MVGSSSIEVRVENLLVRFTPTPRVDLEEAVERLGGVVNGDSEKMSVFVRVRPQVVFSKRHFPNTKLKLNISM